MHLYKVSLHPQYTLIQIQIWLHIKYVFIWILFSESNVPLFKLWFQIQCTFRIYLDCGRKSNIHFLLKFGYTFNIHLFNIWLHRQYTFVNIMVTNPIYIYFNTVSHDIKMKKIADLQLKVVFDPKNKQAIEKQIAQWNENLEKLYIEQTPVLLRCYMASLQGSELPNPNWYDFFRMWQRQLRHLAQVAIFCHLLVIIWFI